MHSPNTSYSLRVGNDILVLFPPKLQTAEYGYCLISPIHTVEKIAFPRSIPADHNIVPFVKWLHHSLLTVTFEALYDHLERSIHTSFHWIRKLQIAAYLFYMHFSM